MAQLCGILALILKCKSETLILQHLTLPILSRNQSGGGRDLLDALIVQVKHKIHLDPVYVLDGAILVRSICPESSI